MKNCFVFVVGFICFMSLVVFSANAATRNVPGDYSTITAALTAASSGDTIVIAAGTYSTSGSGETFPLNLKTGVNIQGAGAGSTILDGEDTYSIFSVGGVTGITVSQLTVTQGLGTEDEGERNGGGCAINTSTITFSNCTFSECNALSDTEDGSGGAMMVFASTVTISDCTFQNNSANADMLGTSGGGIFAFGYINDVVLTVSDSTFTGNSAVGTGGGTAGGAIGAVEFLGGTVTATITDCTFTSNTATGSGGALAVNVTTCTITGCTFSSNSGQNAGAVVGGGTISKCIFNANTAVDIGGGLYVASDATVTNCLFTNNECTGDGSGSGAIVYGSGVDGTFTNCTFSGNIAGVAAIRCSSDTTTMTAINCIFANTTGFGVSDTSDGSGVTLKSNYFYNSSFGNVYISNITSKNTSAEINGINANCENNVGTDAAEDPDFVSSTNFDLQSDSPCVNAGTATGAPSVDIDGTTRPKGTGYDIGCYEYAANTWYFAEGCTRTGYQEYILVENPGSSSAQVTVTYYNGAGETATTDTVTIPAATRYTIDVNDDLSTDSDFNNADVSAKVVPTNNVNIWVDRSMYLTAGAAHSTRGVTSTATTWYFAEGSTDSYETYLLLFNPNTSAASVTLTFMKSDGTTEVEDPITVGANTRVSLDLDDYIADEQFSTKVVSTVAIVAERSMYWEIDGTSRAAGHNSIGATATGTTWYFAEGCTDGFTGWLLLQNPNSSSASVTVTLMKTDGTTEETTTAMYPTSRRTISLDDILDDQSFAIKVVSNVGIVAERSMYWDTGGHCSIGSTSTGTTWYLAEGCTLAVDSDTYTDWLLIQNPGNNSEQVTLTFMDNDGDTQTSYVTILPTSRISVDLGQVISIDGQFSTKAVATDPVVIERSIYKGTGDGHNSIGMQ